MSTGEKKQEEWPEIKKAFESKRYEIILTGNDVNKRLEELNGILPRDLFNLKQLNLLEISKTNVSQLPNELGQLINLNQLILHSNRLIELPNDIGKLVKLQHLDLSGNNLTKLPNEMKNLTELLTLNLSFNKLDSLFESFHGLNKLAVLNISNNVFTRLPDDLFHLNLHNLSDINCSFNQINILNDNVYELESLKVFNLENNCIVHIPGSISKSVKLKELLLKNNKLADNRLRKLIDANKLKAVLEYLEKQYEEECKQAAKNTSKSAKNAKKSNRKDTNPSAYYEHDILIHSFNDLTSKQVFYDENVSQVRPYIVCCIIKNLDLNSVGNFKRFLNIQTKLHDISCDKRTLATIATHDLNSIKGNLVYEAKEASSIKLIPLGRTSEISADEYYEKLYQEAEAERKAKKRNQLSGIYKYLSLLNPKSNFSYVRDSENIVISLPPLTNSEKTRMSIETKEIFVEITSTVSLDVCKKIMEELIVEMTTNNLCGDKQELSINMENLDINEEQKIKSTMIIEQVKIIDLNNSLRCIYPSKIDLNLSDDKHIRVIRSVQ